MPSGKNTPPAFFCSYCPAFPFLSASPQSRSGYCHPFVPGVLLEVSTRRSFSVSVLAPFLLLEVDFFSYKLWSRSCEETQTTDRAERGKFEQAEELGSPTLRSLPCFSDCAPSTAEGPGDSPGVIMSAFCLESSLPDSSPSTTAFVLSMPGCKRKPDHPHHPEKNAKNDDNAVSL